ncbi:hypothetical protein [Minwuia thermotolerans]|nr:hypothetical protein [Minwuia thermotolerans]
MSIRERILAYIAIVAFGGALIACENTIRGVDQDAEETGEAIEDSFE